MAPTINRWPLPGTRIREAYDRLANNPNTVIDMSDIVPKNQRTAIKYRLESYGLKIVVHSTPELGAQWEHDPGRDDHVARGGR